MCEDLNHHQDCARKQQVPLHFGQDDGLVQGTGSVLGDGSPSGLSFLLTQF